MSIEKLLVMCKHAAKKTLHLRSTKAAVKYRAFQRFWVAQRRSTGCAGGPKFQADEGRIVQLLGQLHTNHGSWEAFKEDWRYFFECMLAPSPRQAATALDKLPIVPANRPSAPVSLQESLAKWLLAQRPGHPAGE
eukprot:53806-Pelagomonas_calceolata.AAC.3